MGRKRYTAGLSVLLGVALALALCGFDFAGGTPEPRLVNTLEFTADDYLKLEVHYASDSITLLQSDNDSIVLREYLSHDAPVYHAVVTAENGVLDIAGGQRPENTSFRSYIELSVPAGFASPVNLRSASGNLYCNGAALNAPVFLSSASGGISLRDVGFVLDCRTASGKIQVESGAPSGSINSAAGEITVIMDTPGGDLKLDSASGDVRVSLSPASSFRLRAATGSGSISNAFQGYYSAWERATVYGLNPAYTIDINTASGNISIEKGSS